MNRRIGYSLEIGDKSNLLDLFGERKPMKQVFKGTTHGKAVKDNSIDSNELIAERPLSSFLNPGPANLSSQLCAQTSPLDLRMKK